MGCELTRETPPVADTCVVPSILSQGQGSELQNVFQVRGMSQSEPHLTVRGKGFPSVVPLTLTVRDFWALKLQTPYMWNRCAHTARARYFGARIY